MIDFPGHQPLRQGALGRELNLAKRIVLVIDSVNFRTEKEQVAEYVASPSHPSPASLSLSLSLSLSASLCISRDTNQPTLLVHCSLVYDIMVNPGVYHNNVPILFACNKHDMLTAMSPESIRTELAKELYDARPPPTIATATVIAYSAAPRHSTTIRETRKNAPRAAGEEADDEEVRQQQQQQQQQQHANSDR